MLLKVIPMGMTLMSKDLQFVRNTQAADVYATECNHVFQNQFDIRETRMWFRSMRSGSVATV